MLILYGTIFILSQFHVYIVTQYCTCNEACISTVVYTLYIGIAMVFVFSPYIRRFSSCISLSTFNDFAALHRYQAVYETSKLKVSKCQNYSKNNFPILSFILKSPNSITIDMKLGIWTVFGQS